MLNDSWWAYSHNFGTEGPPYDSDVCSWCGFSRHYIRSTERVCVPAAERIGCNSVVSPPKTVEKEVVELKIELALKMSRFIIDELMRFAEEN